MDSPFHDAKAKLGQAAKILKLSDDVRGVLEYPQRTILVSVPVKMDNGHLQLFKGYRVQYSNARGPYKGGLRFHHEVDLEEVKALAFLMAIKTAVVGIPMGGGKGGVQVNPKELSRGELQRLTRAFAHEIENFVGPQIDVPAPDVNTTPEIMGWIMDEYSKHAGKKTPGVITGKPVKQGGSLGRDTATAQGGMYVLEELAKLKKIKPDETSVVIQGFGNAGRTFAEIADKQGYKVIGVSDSRDGIVDTSGSGLDIKKIGRIKDKTRSVGNAAGSNVKKVSNAKLLETKCDILVVAALGGVITKKNANQIKSKVVMELANGPISPEADAILKKKKVTVLPDVLTNAGGVTVSYFEWYQNVKKQRWSASQVDRKLKKTMQTSFSEVWKLHIKHKVDLRTACFVLAVKRLAEAVKKKRR